MYKTLIKKSTGEYARIIEGKIYTSEVPLLHPDTANLEGLLEYFIYVEGRPHDDLSDLQFIKVELKRI